ncbi:MAG: hypothetical protein V3S86_03290 [Nitrosomonadaceae bacterium]
MKDSKSAEKKYSTIHPRADVSYAELSKPHYILIPPRDEALAAVSRCQPAGTLVKMITGDHVVTARAIGVQLGIGNGQAALTGSNLEKMDETQLQRMVTIAWQQQKLT